MKSTRWMTWMLCGVLTTGLTTWGGKKVTISEGHADIGLAYDEDEWDLHVHVEDEYSPRQTLFLVGSLAQTAVPDDQAFSFLGAPGSTVWILPQVEEEGLIFLGLGTEEIPSGLFKDDSIRLRLAAVRSAGHFSMFALDGFGSVQVHMNTRDGLDQNDEITLTAGGHRHANWAFSRTGRYRLTFEATAELLDGTIVSGQATYTFVVERTPKGQKSAGQKK
jgi:surface-anchored protein